MQLSTHIVLTESGVRYAEGDGHDLDGENTNLAIVLFGAVIDLGEEAGVGVQANADTMDEEDGKTGFGRMRPVPVRQMFGRRAVGCCEGDRAKGEESEKARQRETVEVEACVLELEVGEEVDKAHALPNISKTRCMPICADITRYHSKLRCSISTGSIVSLNDLAVPFPGLSFLPSMLSISRIYSSISSPSSPCTHSRSKNAHARYALTSSRPISLILAPLNQPRM